MSKFHFDQKSRDARLRLTELSRQIGELGVARTKTVFFPTQSYDGIRWRKRAGKDQTRPLLINTGRLFNSIRVIRYSSRSVRWGATGIAAVYGNYQNEGTARIPKRQFIGVDRILKAQINKLVLKYMNSIMKRK